LQGSNLLSINIRDSKLYVSFRIGFLKLVLLRHFALLPRCRVGGVDRALTGVGRSLVKHVIATININKPNLYYRERSKLNNQPM
jgi:hypothetical protein